MTETTDIEYRGYWYQIVLWDVTDYLYHANIKQGNQYNAVHTTGGYLSFSDAETAAKSVIDFMIAIK